MAGISTEEASVERSTEGGFTEQKCQSGEALVEWRCSEQVENGTPSTCPPYWDSDDDDDGGPKPKELYGGHTWKIDKFSQINKRELRSTVFEIGGYRWYILIYPQGCDVCNHLSLFLCVANHDKLLPGWGHFAQFTIAVVNKDPKKSKYSDTLHRFWKKEHDWGWKKFMELSKVFDGFIDADTLIIKAQVQVIRERADRPFRCLDCQYRRELVRVYLTNVEQICRRFVEERRAKLGKLIDDKARWSSFCAFWLGMDQNSRRCMCREKTESILKVLVKHFFIEKEVTSTLVMDALYSGLKTLEGQYKGKKSKGKYLETEELPVPIVRMEKDTFLLVDDVLTLLERAAIEPLPPKDEKGPQNRTKDGALGEEFNKDSIERDERRLTELGRRTIEIFILAHIFSKIEVAYQEAVALKRQEELIREEEAAWLAEVEQKARRGVADKEKKSKKKQGKQKRNNRKGKDKGRDEKHSSSAQCKTEQDIIHAVERDFAAEVAEPEVILEKSDAVEDFSDASDSVMCSPEILPPDSEDTDTSEVHPPMEASSSGISGLSSVQNRTDGRSSSVVDDSSSTCSSDSVPSVANNGSHKGNSRYNKYQKSCSRMTNHQSKVTSEPADGVNAERSQPSKAVLDTGHPVDTSGSFKAVHSPCQVADRMVNGAEKHAGKEEEIGSLHKSPVGKGVGVEASLDSRASCAIPLPRSPSRNTPSIIPPPKLESKDNGTNNLPTVKKPSPESHTKADKSSRPANSAENATIPKPNTTFKPTEKKTSIPVMSRPLSAPLIPGSMPAVSVVSTIQPTPILSRSASSVCRLGPKPSHAPQSYRNAIVGSHVAQNHSGSSRVATSFSYSQVSTPLFSPHHGSVRTDPNQSSSSYTFGLPSRPLWVESPVQGDLPVVVDRASLLNHNMQGFDLYSSVHRRSQDQFPFVRQGHLSPDEFPHLDIINDLLDDENGIGNLSISNEGYHQGFGNGPHYLDRQVSFPGGPSGLGPPAGSCRFERTRNYLDDGFHQSYGASGRDVVPQAGQLPYVNGHHIDGSIPNQWQMGGSDAPFASFGNMDHDPYRVAEYQNPTAGVNSYAVFRPSNGH